MGLPGYYLIYPLFVNKNLKHCNAKNHTFFINIYEKFYLNILLLNLITFI